MIFAAGLGTRLYPYTADRPKALVEVAGKTLLERAILKVQEAGCSEIIINIHHFGQQIIDFLKQKNNFGFKIHISDERENLLDTGGGILKAAPLLTGNEPFLVYNVDIISNINLNELLQYHRSKGGLSTLCVRKRETSRYFIFDNNMRLSGWQNISTGEQIIARESNESTPLAFSGIHLIEPSVFQLITERGKFSIVELYLRLATDEPIYGFNDSSSQWMDLGKPNELMVAEKILAQNSKQ